MRGRVLILAAVVLARSSGVCEGQLTPPGPPNDASSAKFTLGDIWNRLSTGAAGTKRGATFAEPTAAPSIPTMKTTDQIMSVAPSADNTNGATAADVAAGKTFWGLRTGGGSWGVTTGTAYPAPVAKTGQTQCYNGNVPAACPGSPAGLDGALQKGVAWPIPRFTDNANGTVTDNLTGLVWLKNADCYGRVEWQTAMANAATLGSGSACGLSDGSAAGQWRLPTIGELQSLIHFGYINRALPNTAGTGQHADGDPFTNVGDMYYWSSTIATGYPTYAWSVGFVDGPSGHLDKNLAARVWPVRGGQ